MGSARTTRPTGMTSATKLWLDPTLALRRIEAADAGVPAFAQSVDEPPTMSTFKAEAAVRLLASLNQLLRRGVSRSLSPKANKSQLRRDELE